MAKLRLAVLFGGISPEHEVSVITAVQLMKNVDREKYDLFPIYIDKAGRWWTSASLFDIAYYGQQDLFTPQGLEPFQLILEPQRNSIDAAILCFHGQYGEGGAIQGALDLAQIPYQGPGLLSSAINFDKVVLRQILSAEHFDQPKYVWFTKLDWEQRAPEIKAEIAQLNYPVFLKPANGGSTIGVEKVKSEAELTEKVAAIAEYDWRLIVEEAIEDSLEINVSVVGIEGDITASVPEQPIKSEEFLSYADKYERGGGKKAGMASATRRIPAPISSELTAKVQAIAKRIFHVFDCSGVIRIDFFVNPSTGVIKVIEPNTIPGSMSYYLWQASGMAYPQLIDKLVEVALKDRARKDQRTTSFSSNILKNKTSI